jgi:hypothetical protein
LRYGSGVGGGSGAQPHAPSAFLAGIGKGRLGRTRRPAVLERHDGTAWHEVGRFGSVRDADRALDEAVGNGGTPDSLRVVENDTASNRALVIAGAIAVGAALAIVLYFILG